MEETKITQENSLLFSDAMWEYSMTIFFNKRTGKIMQISTGIQDMNAFGDEKEDFELIWDFIVVEKDTFVMSNTDQFLVDIETKELTYIPLVDTSKYRMR
ncbi:hypothetical protein [Turicibacter sanguinis]|uniref:hypothetical protein n=1 Tax=Turicibacter sanguinis TaxID=154288 RepID=UPI003990EBF8